MTLVCIKMVQRKKGRFFSLKKLDLVTEDRVRIRFIHYQCTFPDTELYSYLLTLNHS